MGIIIVGAVLALTGFGVPTDSVENRLWGRVVTADGAVHEGWLRFDRKDVGLYDFLDAEKELPWEHLHEAESLDPVLAERGRRERSLEAFGVRITWDRDDTYTTLAPTSLRYRLVDALVVADGRRAVVRLRSGAEVVVHGGSNDEGASLRTVVVETATRVVELRWRDVDQVELHAPPAGAHPPRERRLTGTVHTRSGLELTGLIAWDRDEIFPSDVLDGDDESRVERAIPFSEIAEILPESDRSARVVFRDGRETVLRGTNDVDEDNRGIEVIEPAGGRAVVYWEDLERVRFHRDSIPAVAPDALPTGPLRGTVRRTDGTEVTGRIRWDNEEREGWEPLDGWYEDVRYAVEFGRIASIAKVSRGSVRVTLTDGRVLELTNDDDVDRGNRGIFVARDGASTQRVTWDDFDRVDFTW